MLGLFKKRKKAGTKALYEKMRSLEEENRILLRENKKLRKRVEELMVKSALSLDISDLQSDLLEETISQNAELLDKAKKTEPEEEWRQRIRNIEIEEL